MIFNRHIWTIGHYNYSEQEFAEFLFQQGINMVVDVRSLPGSKRNPQYNQENMEFWLPTHGIQYTYLPRLGGRRRAQNVEPTLNDGWKNASFKNYADYTTTQEFLYGIQDLEYYAEINNVAYMCGEPHPSRCHRLLISNVLVTRGWHVTHIIGNEHQEHEFGMWGAEPRFNRVSKQVTYPSQTPLYMYDGATMTITDSNGTKTELVREPQV